jgi:hypothetical protein
VPNTAGSGFAFDAQWIRRIIVETVTVRWRSFQVSRRSLEGGFGGRRLSNRDESSGTMVAGVPGLVILRVWRNRGRKSRRGRVKAASQDGIEQLPPLSSIVERIEST